MLNKSLTAVLYFILIINQLLTAQIDQYKFVRFDVSNGLSHNQVNCILKDRKGFMWFGTMSGLNRFDGYASKVFIHDFSNPHSINDNYIISVFEDPCGKIWVNTRNGLNIYDPETETFSQNVYSYLKQLSLPDNSVSNIIKDKNGNYWFLGTKCRLYKYFSSFKKNVKVDLSFRGEGNSRRDVITSAGFNSKNELWVVYQSGILLLVNSENFKTIYRTDFLRKFNGGETFKYNLFIDSDDDLWICCPDSPIGAFYFNPSTRSFLHIDKGNGKKGLNTNQILSIVQDNKGLIWIGTDHGGINLLDKKDFSVSYLLNNPEDKNSLSQNSIYSLYKDNLGIIWAGTYKRGVDYFHEDIFRFGLFKHLLSDPQSLGYDDVNCFCEDPKGNIWIGTNVGGLNYYNRHTGKFKHFVHEAGNSNSLSNNVIVSLYEDRGEKLWIGTYCGGLDCYDGLKFTHFMHEPSNSGSISQNSIWSILEDYQHNLWIGTLGGGLDRFDRNRKVFYHYRAGYKNSVRSDYITSLTEDKDKNLWVGTAEGVDELLRKNGRFVHYGHNNDPKSLSNNNVLAVACDLSGNIWIGTRDGLNLFEKGKRRFKIFRKNDGLPDNSILTALADNLGKMWFSTPNGISSLTFRKDKKANKDYFIFRNFDESDGLQGKEFNEKAACKTSQGELLFGGANGFNIIRPSSITMSRTAPRVVFTDLQIFNKSVGVNEEVKGKVVLKKAISETSEIVLKYSDNVFSVEFAALNFLHPEKVKYIYRLKGFNKTWLTTDGYNRRITYTNLNPGEYYFIVKASNNDGLWNGQEAQLKITVLPPFWKSNFAILLYLIFVAGLLFLLRWLELRRARMNYRNEQELQEAQRRHDMDMMKIKFFTNVSHEFRTPLTLIISPLEQMLKKLKNSDQEKQLALVYRNARRLLNLVNQLLDFRKMEVDEIKLHPTFGDIIQFLKETTLTFSDISEKKDIHLSFYSSVSGFNTLFDHEKLERTLFNLLSNAFKFTPSKGSVSVEIELENEINGSKTASEKIGNEVEWLIIKVKDTGIGISEEKHEQIFERFFQNDLPGSLMNQGSGIGLALTKEYVKLQGGTIDVESALGKGSCFTLHLPFNQLEEGSISEEVSYLAIDSGENVNETSEMKGFKVDKKKPLILIVEDNEDFRFYLKDNLKQRYNILEAENGEEGWERILTYMPDLIVSDIMMPEMDGIDLCHRIKTDRRTFDIPVILLTARITDEQKLEGFEHGADEYITKPFSFEILEVRIKNLIAQRQNLRKSYQKKIEIKSEEIKIDSADEQFIKKATDLVERELSHPEFSVETLSRELGMSRVHLYKKVLALTGKTPIEFIRFIRLKRAAQLLEKSDLSVSEVAYRIGFNNPKYFAKYFKAEFNTLPSMYASLKHQEKESETK